MSYLYLFNHSAFLLLFILASAIIMLAITRFDIFHNANNKVGLFFIAMIVLNVATLFYQHNSISKLTYTVFTFAPGLNFTFSTENLGLGFALMSCVLWFITHAYAAIYFTDHTLARKLCYHIALAMISVLGIAFSANLITLFVFYEMLTLFTYPLIKFNNTDEEAASAAKKYLNTLLGTSLLFFLPAIIISYHDLGNVEFRVGSSLEKISPHLSFVLLVLFVLGIAKTALMPLHRWLKAAMVAPFPVTGLLHGVAVVKSGIFAILKISLYILKLEVDFMGEVFLATIASFSAVGGAIMAARQTNIKAMLAYSTISQLAYSMLIMAIMSKEAINASFFYMVSHAFAKIGLFFAAGYFYLATNHLDIKYLSGIGKKMPFVTACFTICAFSLMGMPPFIGFWSKLYLFYTAYPVNLTHLYLMIVIIVTTVLSAAYFLPVLYKLWYEKHEPEILQEFNARPLLLITLVVIFGGLLINQRII
jgi:multicomponent Na+:H+ antiporter subunit D